MTAHPTVPPLRRRTPPETIVPTHEPTPAKAAPKHSKIMLYLPPDMLDNLDDFLIDARREHGRRVDRSELIRACIELAYNDHPDALMDRIGVSSQ